MGKISDAITPITKRLSPNGVYHSFNEDNGSIDALVIKNCDVL